MIVPDHTLAKLYLGEPPFLSLLYFDQTRAAQSLVRGRHGSVQPVRLAEERVYPCVRVSKQIEQHQGVYRVEHRRIWVKAPLGKGVRGWEERIVPFLCQVPAFRAMLSDHTLHATDQKENSPGAVNRVGVGPVVECLFPVKEDDLHRRFGRFLLVKTVLQNAHP